MQFIVLFCFESAKV